MNMTAQTENSRIDDPNRGAANSGVQQMESQMHRSANKANNSSNLFAGCQPTIWRMALTLIVIAGPVWLGFHVRNHEPRADKPVTNSGAALPNLRGAAAAQYLRERGLYDSLREAVKDIPYQVRRVRQSGQEGLDERIESKPSPGGTATYEGRNTAQQFNAYFSTEGLCLQSVAAAPESWRLAMTLRRVGYGSRAINVEEGEIKAAGNRVEIRREARDSQRVAQITEWYVNDQAGLEHGFTLAAAPPVERQGDRLRLELALNGDLQPRVAADGQSVSLLNSRGEQTLNYSGLVVKDATGRELEARLMPMRKATGDELAIEVDDAWASYPIVIDPTFFQPQKLTANDLEAFDFFGATVALSGGTALVGAPSVGVGGHGAAYVFVREDAAWTLEQKLVASDGAANDLFGRSVALDGDTALVGASGDDISAAADRGSAYVFTRVGTVWSQQQKLTAGDGAADDEFGRAVALDGDTALVGASGDDVSGAADRGSAYVFTRAGAVWSQQQKLTASDGAAGDFFGYAVSLSGETALVGAYSDDVGGNISQGSAYVFVRSMAAWTQQQKLTASDGAVADQFGGRVALSGDTAVIGVPQDDVGADLGQGSAYVFTRAGTVWSQQQKLNAADGDTADAFGQSVAINGDAVLIGAIGDDSNGSAYVFQRSGTTWSQYQKLAADDGDAFGSAVALDAATALVGASGNGGAAYIFPGSNAYSPQAQIIPADGAADDFLGVSVAISGDTALIGAPEDDIGSDEDQGSVYVFVRSGAGWTQQQEIIAADGGERDLFGWSVSLSGDTALIGAFGDDIGGAANRGSAYVYLRSGANWSQQAKMTAADGASGDAFGFAVAVDGDTALVGAYLDDLGRGAAYVFTRSGSAWSQQQKLTGSDSLGGDQFGFAVALSGDTALVGAPGDDIGLDSNQGSAYVFTRSGVFWSQQQKLADSNGGPSDQFGQSVALSGETALIGAPFDNIAGVSNLGSAFVFVRSGGDWSQQAKLTAPDGEAEDQFGNAVALSGETALIGSHLTDLIPNGSGDQGAAHIFHRSGASWTRIQKLLAGNSAPGDEFSYSVAISGDTAVVGAPYRRVGANVNQGAAYIFDNCPNAITINPATLPEGRIGAPYDQILTGSGGFAPYSFSVIAGSLPANMTLSAAGALSGAPTQSGDFNFTVEAIDQNGCSGSRAYALTINTCPLIDVTPASLPAGAVGVAYSQALIASGGARPYALSVIAGALPAGLSLPPGGVLLGLPREPGVFKFTIGAADANGCVGWRAYTLRVNCADITVSPSTLPKGAVGSPYRQTITASGGIAPHTFTITAGAIPDGLTLSADGALSGSPTSAGAFKFTVQATDRNRCTGAREYSMIINDVTIK
jgi:FG-GAP repeat/Putative Ig domain